MSDKSLKVTDRRMFTPDGELREEFSHLREVPADAASPSSPAGESAPGAPEPAAPPRSAAGAAARPIAAEPPAASPATAAREAPGLADPGPAAPGEADPGRDAPGFFDLVGLLAEPAAHYMRESRTAPPQAASQSLALARLHIDLLSVLEDKTQGNLTPEEKAMLDDVVYQLRSGFVGLGG